MRISAGKVKNKRIKSLKGQNTRPTTNKMKESLFNIISNIITDSIFLDLFSGTGNIALEALSRGAKRAIMIEQDPEALKLIIENVNTLGFTDQARAYKNDVKRAIEILGKKNEIFDIIFLDPPYQRNLSLLTIEKILACNILEKNGIIIAEHHKREILPDKIGALRKFNEKIYGNKVLSFFS